MNAEREYGQSTDQSVWGRTYNRYLSKGHDHGSAAWAADQAEARALSKKDLRND